MRLQHLSGGKDLFVLIASESGKCFCRVVQIRQSSSFSFLDPLSAVAITVENDWEVLLQELSHGVTRAQTTLDLIAQSGKAGGHSCVHESEGQGNVLTRSHGPELKPVA